MALCAQRVISLILLPFLLGAAIGALLGNGSRRSRFITASLCGVQYAVLALRFGITVYCLQMWLLLGLLTAAALSDLKCMEIPDTIPIAAAIEFAVFLPFAERPLELLTQGLRGAAAIGGSMLILSWCADRLTGHDALGGGDIKLFMVLGLHFGIQKGTVAIAIACLLGLIFCAVRRIGKESPFPFVPAITAGAFITAVFGDRLIRLFLYAAG